MEMQHCFIYCSTIVVQFVVLCLYIAHSHCVLLLLMFFFFFLSFYNLQRRHLKVKYCVGYFHKFLKLHVSVKVQTVLMLVMFLFLLYSKFFLLFQPLWKLLTDMVSNERTF